MWGISGLSWWGGGSGFGGFVVVVGDMVAF